MLLIQSAITPSHGSTPAESPVPGQSNRNVGMPRAASISASKRQPWNVAYTSSPNGLQSTAAISEAGRPGGTGCNQPARPPNVTNGMGPPRRIPAQH